METINTGTIIANRWKIGKLLGEGACGKVYETILSTQSTKVIDYSLVIKVIPKGLGKGKKAIEQNKIANTLFYEYSLHVGVLQGFPYGPRLPERFYGDNETIRYLVMEKFDRDLESFAKNSPSVSDIANVGLDILKGLKWIHGKGYLFIDIKPQNFMQKNGKTYFVDFGLMERWLSFDSSGTRPDENRAPVGTPAFLSIATHDGFTPTRQDEIESFGLLLLSLAENGKLPWSNSISDEKCRESKRNCNILEFSRNLGMEEVGDIILTARSDKKKLVDYDLIETKLKTMSSNNLATKKKRTSVSRSISTSIVTSTKETVVSPKRKLSSVSIAKPVKLQSSEDLNPFSLKLESENVSITSSRNQMFTHREILDLSTSPSTALIQDKKSIVKPKIKSKEASDVIDNVESSHIKRPSYRVDVTSGPHHGLSVTIEKIQSPMHKLTIGRATNGTVDISLPLDEEVSEKHFQIKICSKPGGISEISIMDFSTNGTMINATKLSKRRWVNISSTEEIKIGQTTLKTLCK